ncbi:putative bulb-type lectin domain-containing protein [Helianthus debilis subsp. tardiflorus]
MKICSFFFAYFLTLIVLSCYSPTAQFIPTANLSTTWSTQYSLDQPVPILLTESKVAKFVCGFINEHNYASYIFAIFISPTSEFTRQYEVVWSANRNSPVGENAVLNFAAAGELVLTDIDGSIAWTTNTAGKSVAGMNLTDTGNLV